ncbi:hypothetical protein [Methylobacter sp. YRD-M1]|uniref:hypothetical protein n=1 Tax=Methylobacter sp. YRD-M1 TaxID=2911520 RepID=UPI00227B2EA2|nr:hypothetical protein [Methylobacter sp. YRD-M1]WAK02088.1 hypothetical protein LZ558_20110 [Methylobacter sp. YRD-M1]
MRLMLALASAFVVFQIPKHRGGAVGWIPSHNEFPMRQVLSILTIPSTSQNNPLPASLYYENPNLQPNNSPRGGFSDDLIIGMMSAAVLFDFDRVDA